MEGVPPLQRSLSFSSPYVPLESEHAPCGYVECPMPYLPPVPNNVLHAPNLSWGNLTVRRDNGVKDYRYSSESDVFYFVRRYIESILTALGLSLTFSGELSIKQIRSDLCVLLLDRYMVGVVEVKKPGNNILRMPTVLGDLMDQMLLVEGFYGMGPAIGILTTGEEWLIAWFPDDSAALSQFEQISWNAMSTSSSTETKGKKSLNESFQQRSTIRLVESSPNLENAITPQMKRLLCTTRLINIHDDPVCVLQHLCGAIQLMTKSHLHYIAKLSKCVLQFHKGDEAVTFHSAPSQVNLSNLNFTIFPDNNVNSLVTLKDLGRGATGKAWLCSTLTKPVAESCVLKFDNKHEKSRNLAREKAMWHLIYPEFCTYVKVENWSGADALVMPYFCPVLEAERDSFKDEVSHMLTRHFAHKMKVHTDVHWRNIGKYKTKDGTYALIVFDLHDVVDFDEKLHINWIKTAVDALYINVQSVINFTIT